MVEQLEGFQVRDFSRPTKALSRSIGGLQNIEPACVLTTRASPTSIFEFASYLEQVWLLVLSLNLLHLYQSRISYVIAGDGG